MIITMGINKVHKLWRKRQRHLQRQPQWQTPAGDWVSASRHTLARSFRHSLRHVSIAGVKKRSEAKHWPLIEGLVALGLCSRFSGSVHCSDSGDKNVACVSLRALACLQNASVLWSRHRPAGRRGGEGRSVGPCGGRNKDRREQPQSGLPASWLDCWKLLLSSCVGPPLPVAYSSVLTTRYCGRGKERSWQPPVLLCNDLICNK